MTAPIVPQPDPNAAPPNPPATDAGTTATPPQPTPQVDRVPFAELIEQQRNGTLIGRIAPRLYDGFSSGIVDAITGEPDNALSSGPGSTPSGELGGDGGAAVGSSLPTAAPSTTPPGTTPPAAPSPPPLELEAEWDIDGKRYTTSQLRDMLAVADRATHVQPMLEALATGDYVLAPKSIAQPRVEQPLPAPIVDPVEQMIEQYAETDPQGAQIMRLMQSRFAADRARAEAEIATLRSATQESQEVQQANGLNRGVAEFARAMNMDEASALQLAQQAGQTGYLPMMLQKRYDAAQQAGVAVDHEAVARDAAIELLNYQYRMSQPASFQQSAPAPAPSPAPAPIVVPPTSQVAPPATEAEIEARVQQRVAEEVARRDRNSVHTALAGGSSGTPGSAPAPVDLSSMTPQQRRAYHDQQLVAGIAELQRNGALGGGGWGP